MKKKVYVALLSLCCPIMLNTQQVFAEEAAGESTPTSETVGFEDQLSEGGPEELPAVSEPEVSEEAPEVTEETTDTTEETVVEETDVTEETVESTESTEAEVEESEELTTRALQLMTFTITFVDEAGNFINSAAVSEEVGTVIGIPLPTNGYFVVDTPVGSGFSVELDASNNPVLVGEITSASADFTVTMRAFNASGDAQINFV
ncbi:hypothetical protein, partial [uncultured Enterococcus sp.]|uniref:hypothetical protein n=1 Tax=uncultured Enterococcus sp. TaxID=167972 RepID=UPI002AA7E6F3